VVKYGKGSFNIKLFLSFLRC